MTLELRQLHSRAFALLRLALPAVLLLTALGYRLPVRSPLPQLMLHRLPEGAEKQFEEQGVYEGVSLRVELWRQAPASALAMRPTWVRIEALEPVRQPDMVVYWSSRGSAFDQPPLGSYMLGVWDSRTPEAYKLPPQAAYLRGYLVFYSVGQHVLVSQVRLPSIDQ